MKGFLFLLLAGLIAALGFYYWKTPYYSDGELAPDFTAPTPNGNSLKLSDFKGQYVLLDFWGSWCGPCRRENPYLVQLYNKYQNTKFQDASNFTIFSVGIEMNPKAWKAAIAKDGLIWPNHVSTVSRFKDPVAKLYGVREIPSKFLIGPKGNILNVNQSVEEIDAFLAGKRN